MAVQRLAGHSSAIAYLLLPKVMNMYNYRLATNDVGSILGTYGVEAARATLMREVSSVFGAYGIGVDPRHLGLIADFMTHQVTAPPGSVREFAGCPSMSTCCCGVAAVESIGQSWGSHDSSGVIQPQDMSLGKSSSMVLQS